MISKVNLKVIRYKTSIRMWLCRLFQTEGVADSGYRQEPYIKRLCMASMLGGKTQSHSTTT